MKIAPHDSLRMKRFRKLLFLPVVACGGLMLLVTTADREDDDVRGGGGRGTDSASAGHPPRRPGPRDRPRRDEKLPADRLVTEWLEAASAAHGETPGETPGIFVSSRPSPERQEAFRKLLGGLKQRDAGELHDLLDACSPAEPGALSDEEWSAFLGKWGRLDGAGAAGHLGSLATAGHRVPEMVRGWAAVDPDAVGAWLGDLPEYPWKAAAATAFASIVVEWDPGTALGHASSLQGPWRDRALHLVESSWPEGASGADRTALEEVVSGKEGVHPTDATSEPGFDLLRPQDWSGADNASLETLGIHITD